MEEQRQRMEDEARRTQAESATETPAGTETPTTGNQFYLFFNYIPTT
jgi:hypothetical protein